MDIVLAAIGIIVTIVIGVWQIWLARKQNNLADKSQDLSLAQSAVSDYEDKVVEYLNTKSAAALIFAPVVKGESTVTALRMNQGEKLIVDKPAYWKDVYASGINKFSTSIHIEVRHSRDVRPEGRGRHSREVPNRVVHTLEFLLANSGGETLVVKSVGLVIIHSEVNSDYYALGMTVEAGPVHTYVIEGVELHPNKSKLDLQNKLIQIEPNGVVAYRVALKSKLNYTYRVRFVFHWIDIGSKKVQVSFSEPFILDFPEYGLGTSVDELKQVESIEVTPLIFNGKLNPLVSKILLNPKHNYYDRVVQILKYDSTRPANEYIRYLRAVVEDPNALVQVKEAAHNSLHLLGWRASESPSSGETN